MALALVVARPAQAQKPTRDTTVGTGVTAGEADDERLRRALLKRLEFNLGFTTIHFGGGVLIDYAGYDPDSASREQFTLVSRGKLRDARILTGGRFKLKRPVTWQVGIMYDQVKKSLFFRQTGIMVAVPEIYSWFFVGRAKEGFSLNKVMVGYDGWSMERFPFSDAAIPLLADGIKWLGYIPSKHWFWNLGWFDDALSQGHSFSTYDNQFVMRTGWVPMGGDSTGTLLHLGVNFRAGVVSEDSLLLRARPEVFASPFFVSTGSIPAHSALAFGPEVYFRPGRVLMGSEYYWQKVRSPETGNPWFYGGTFLVTWNTTGETRSYNTVGNYFRSVSPDSTVIQGGPGAWEPVLTFSYINLTNGPVQGGKFWRVTPMINWYLTDNLRLEFAYGYGSLRRFGIRGGTQFFQSRFQFRL